MYILIGIIIVLNLLDKFVFTRKQVDITVEEVAVAHNDINPILLYGRIFYLVIYIAMALVVAVSTDGDIGITTEPDYESIKLATEDTRFDLTGDYEDWFYKQAEVDTNGYYWGVFFIVTGVVGIIFRISIISSRITGNPYGPIQYIVNSMCIIIGVYLFFRIPVHEFMGWDFNVGNSYYDILNTLGLEKQQ